MSKLAFCKILLVATGLGTGLPMQAGAESPDCHGIWSASGQPLFDEAGDVGKDSASPDGRWIIRGSNDGLKLIGQQKSVIIPQSYQFANPPLTEAVWSPTSREFAINASDGGSIGSWNAYVFAIDKDGMPKLRNVLNGTHLAANTLVKCDSAMDANLGVAGWLRGGQEMLAVGEVPNDSVCKNAGATFGFRVNDRSGKVVARASQEVLLARWGKVLGCYSSAR